MLKYAFICMNILYVCSSHLFLVFMHFCLHRIELNTFCVEWQKLCQAAWFTVYDCHSFHEHKPFMKQILRFNDDIEWMTGKRPNLYWQITWRFISPLMLLVVFVAYIVVEASTVPTYPAWNPAYVST